MKGLEEGRSKSTRRVTAITLVPGRNDGDFDWDKSIGDGENYTEVAVGQLV